MEFNDNVIGVRPFVALTTAIIVLFVGKALNERFRLLSEFNISQSVSGGLLISMILAAIYFAFKIEVHFNVASREYLLVYFFTAIGINTKLHDLIAARRLVVVLFLATIAYMALQDFIAVAIASALGKPGPEALLAGTIALTGGSDTVVAWAPELENDFSVANVREIGVASAAFGLILGSLIGGPIARHLTQKHGLKPKMIETAEIEKVRERNPATTEDLVFLRSILAIHICIMVGLAVNQVSTDAGLALPVPAACFFVALILTNIIPRWFPGANWPSRTGPMFLIAELSLGILFGMSLISAQLWVIIDLPPYILAIILVQSLVTAAVTIVFVFRMMGRDYDAAVMCSGFAGLALGSASTAMANIKAAAKHSGTSHMGFIIVPLVAVFCIDAVNGFLVRMFLLWF